MCHILWHYTVRRHVYTWETHRINAKKDAIYVHRMILWSFTRRWISWRLTQRFAETRCTSGRSRASTFAIIIVLMSARKGARHKDSERREREWGWARRHAEKSRNIGSRVSLWRAKTHTHTEDIKPYYYRYYSIARSLKCSSNDVPCCWRRRRRRRRYNVRSEYWTQM